MTFVLMFLFSFVTFRILAFRFVILSDASFFRWFRLRFVWRPFQYYQLYLYRLVIFRLLLFWFDTFSELSVSEMSFVHMSLSRFLTFQVFLFRFLLTSILFLKCSFYECFFSSCLLFRFVFFIICSALSFFQFVPFQLRHFSCALVCFVLFRIFTFQKCSVTVVLLFGVSFSFLFLLFVIFLFYICPLPFCPFQICQFS